MSNVKKEDIRIVKTDRALVKALETLLELRAFAQITIMDLCNEALVSRATFYAHFDDKYDLLKYWLKQEAKVFPPVGCEYSMMEAAIKGYLSKNKRILKNIFCDVNDEIVQLLIDWIITDLFACDIATKDSRQLVTLRFFAGGLLYSLIWQERNKYPDDVPLIDAFIYQSICKLTQRESE